MRAGISRLKAYFSPARRPAAVLLLLQQLNNADFIRERSTAMAQLVKDALPGNDVTLSQLTPLGRLEDMTRGGVE